MRIVRWILLGIVLGGGYLANGAMPTTIEAVLVDKIQKAAPARWSVAEIYQDRLPDGHYWGMKYDGAKGLLLILQGKDDVFIQWGDKPWGDKTGNWHKEPIAKEALFVWLMPPDYGESWKRIFVPSRPATAPLLFAGNGVKVYAVPGSRVVDEERMKSLLKQAASTGWPDSPYKTGVLSWKTWREDLIKALQGQ